MVLQKVLPNQETVEIFIGSIILVSLALLLFTGVLLIFVITCLRIYDYLSPLPLPKLRVFVDDLSNLLVQEEGSASSPFGGNYRQRRAQRIHD